MSILQVNIPKVFKPVFTGKYRYRGAYGGRGSSKSWSFAQMAIVHAYTTGGRVVCAREKLNSIRESVHQLLSDQIKRMGLHPYFHIGKSYIEGKNGSLFIYKGLRDLSADDIKSFENASLCWVEEAQTVPEASWNALIPTIRLDDSEIWVTFNPRKKGDATYQRFVVNPPSDSAIVKANWYDNPFMNDVLTKEKDEMLLKNPDMYPHVWEGECLTISKTQVMYGKWEIGDFEDFEKWRPSQIKGGPYYGADWGFSPDPNVLLRCWIGRDNKIYIDHAVYSEDKCDIVNLPPLFDQVPNSRKYLIKADNARPETISHMKNAKFKIEGVKKWPGSVEDGISVLRSYDKIVIHKRCDRLREEAKEYSHKVDKLSGIILPDIEDGFDHGWDALRYALSPIIKQSTAGVDYNKLNQW
jgi:phage terminase large subunit